MKLAPLQMTEDLHTGIEVIDRQHKEYIQRANKILRFSEHIWENEKKLIDDTLNYLWIYTIEHFSTEEDLMRECNYPYLVEHKKKHAEFREKFPPLRTKILKNGPTQHSIEQLNYFMRDWFLEQINIDDKKLTQYLKEEAKNNKKLVRKLKELLQKLF